MTRTTEIWYHPDRPLIHFGSPADHTYWREPEPVKPKKNKSKGKKRKDGPRG